MILFNECSVNTYNDTPDFWDQTQDKKSPRLPSKALKLIVFGATQFEERLICKKFHAFEVLFVDDPSLESIFSWCSFHPEAKVLLKSPGEANLASFISYFTATKMRFATYKSSSDIAQLQIVETFF